MSRNESLVPRSLSHGVEIETIAIVPDLDHQQLATGASFQGDCADGGFSIFLPQFRPFDTVTDCVSNDVNQWFVQRFLQFLFQPGLGTDHLDLHLFVFDLGGVSSGTLQALE